MHKDNIVDYCYYCYCYYFRLLLLLLLLLWKYYFRLLNNWRLLNIEKKSHAHQNEWNIDEHKNNRLRDSPTNHFALNLVGPQIACRLSLAVCHSHFQWIRTLTMTTSYHRFSGPEIRVPPRWGAEAEAYKQGTIGQACQAQSGLGFF